MYEGEPDPTGPGLLYSTPSLSPASVPAQGKYHKTHHNMVDYYVPHTLLYLCTKSLHHITHTTTWWVTVSHTLCTAYHIPLYHITYYEVLQYSTTLYHTQHHIPTLYIPLYPYPCFLPLYNTQKSNVLHTCSKHIRVCHSVEQFPDAVTVTLCQCIACMHRSLPYLHCPQVLYLPTNHIVWRDMLVQCKRSGVERGGGGGGGARGGRIKMVSSVGPSCC